jgi:hypothetical protein
MKKYTIFYGTQNFKLVHNNPLFIPIPEPDKSSPTPSIL